MKYAVLISTQRKPGLLAYLTGDLFHRGIFPGFLSCEAMGMESARIRLEIDCDEKTIKALAVYWEQTLRITMAIVTPLPADGSPISESTPASHGR